MVDTKSDKYLCFECFSRGNCLLKKCLKCHRFFHKKCMKSESERKKELEAYINSKSPHLHHHWNEHEDKENDASSSQLCYSCCLTNKAQKRTEPTMTKEEVNYLLNFIYKRIVGWISNGSVDLNILSQVERKVRRKMYEFPEEFLIDMMDIRFKTAIEHGTDSLQMQCVNYMYTDALFEVNEAVNCPDCFRHSNEKFDCNWFSKPCSRKEHQLVYAKMTHFPYWPAKVIRMEGDFCDIRFFGHMHSRYIINKSHLKPITEDICKLNNGSICEGLRVALDELQKYRHMLKQGKEKFSFENERRNNRSATITEASPNQKTNILSQSISAIARKIEKNIIDDDKNTNGTVTAVPGPSKVIAQPLILTPSKQLEDDLNVSDDEDDDEQVSGIKIVEEHGYCLPATAASVKKQHELKIKEKQNVTDNQKKRKIQTKTHLNEPCSSKKIKPDEDKIKFSEKPTTSKVNKFKIANFTKPSTPKDNKRDDQKQKPITNSKRKQYNEKPSTSKAYESPKLARVINENQKRDSGRKVDIDKNKDTKNTPKAKSSNMEREKIKVVKKTLDLSEKTPIKKDELIKNNRSTPKALKALVKERQMNETDENREIFKEKLKQMTLINKKLKREEAQRRKEETEIQRIKTELLNEKGEVVESRLDRRLRHIRACFDLMEDIENVKKGALKLIKIEAERLLKVINEQKEEINGLKKKLWCLNCSKEVNYIVQYYCSKECQNAHIAASAIKLE